LKPKIVFTQSTAVSHKYFNDGKVFCLLQFSPDDAQNSLMIPGVFHVQINPWTYQVCGKPEWSYFLSTTKSDTA